jgi:hypothetical protein
MHCSFLFPEFIFAFELQSQHVLLSQWFLLLRMDQLAVAIEICLARVSGSGLILLDLLHGTDGYHGLVGALFLNPMGCDILSQ